MSSINKTKCDGPGCDKEKDNDSFGAPTYHRLAVGGSDFELSFGQAVVDFCCADCLVRWVKGNISSKE